MSQTRLTYLLQRYFEDTATPEEVEEFLPYLEDPAKEDEIRRLMEDHWKVHVPDRPVFPAEKSKEMLTGILTAGDRSKIIPQVNKVKWYYAAAAIVVLLVSSIMLYNSGVKNDPEPAIAKTNTTTEDIAPGGFKAMLTLADQSTIVLDSAANGILMQQGNTKVIKKDNGAVAYVSAEEPGGERLFNTLATPKGGEYQLVLPDGTKAWLNAASSLRFPSTFGKGERRVEVTGEVYFEVVKDAARPFIAAITGKAEVKVLGTHFNVNAYSDEAAVTTTLLEGSVKVSNTTLNESLTIVPGEQVQLKPNGELQLNKNVETEQVVAWKDGLFNFSNADLLTVLRQLSRWYDVEIAFEGAVPKKSFGGELQRDLALGQVIKLFERNNVFLKIEGRKLVVLNK